MVVAGAPRSDAVPTDDDVRAALRVERAAGASRRDAAATVARRLGIPKRVAYDLATAEVDAGVDGGTGTTVTGGPSPE